VARHHHRPVRCLLHGLGHVGYLDRGGNLVKQPQIKIKSACWVCRVTPEDITRGVVIVSPTGKAHHSDYDGRTTCGKDATGENWWWPL
jgi:hypothetical protein